MSSGGVMLSGWLRKSPPENKLKSRHHSWKKRWFVLKSGRLSGDPNVLEYSKYQTSKKPIKTIDLNDCIQIDVNVSVPIKSEKKDASEHFIFSVVTSPRTFYLIADSIREMSTWVQCLCDLCGFNHDSNDKGDIGRQKRTFKAAQPASVNVNGTNASSSLLPGGASPVPAPSPRPEKTLTEASRPIDQPPASFLNGTINSSFSHPSQDGYEDSHSKAEISFAIHPTTNKGPDIFHERVDAALMRPDLPILRSEVDDGDTGYLHLADCDTGVCDDDSAFLTVEKTDDRRCSTDSVFAHDDGTDDSKDEESPPMPNILPPKSRFLHDAGGRLDSMPTVPPPPPPTDVPTLARYNDDEDDVVDARRKPTFSGGRHFSRLPPIDDTGLYNVPPGLQRDARFADDARLRQGSNSSSSHGSGSGFGSDGRYSAKMLSPPDYINTQESRGSGSFSGVGPLSGSSISSAGHLSASPVNLGNQIYDVPSPLSPVFPMSTSPRPSYQVPQSLEKSILTRNVPTMELNNNTENIMKSHLKGVQMLDVSALSTSQTDSTYASAQDVGVQQRPIDLGLAGNMDNTYAVPPIRPPKPSGPPQYGEGLYSSPRGGEGLYSSPRGGEGLYSSPRSGEGLYSSPRSHSSSSAGTLEQATYDTVRHPVSPAHSTVIGTMPHLSPNSSRKMGNRNAISATNSPMATPDMTRRIDINKTPSFNSKISPLVQQSRGVSGSAPSLYDVPQPLRKSPGFGRPETKLSQSSSTSGEGQGSGRNSAMDSSNIYDLPRKLSDVSPNASVIQRQDAIPKVDDLSHPSYEKMAAQPGFHDDIQDDPNTYTAMAGVMSTPRMDAFMSSQVPPMHSMHTRLVDDLSRQDVPPPVHRDLKPGRKSLGSDSGLHQSGSDRRTKNSRDSYESDEAISPPHTSVTHTIPVLTEPKHFPYGASISPLGSRSGSLTSPQHNNRMVPSPTPPQRPPKSSFSSASPRSPPMATSPNQLPGRPYTPTHGSHKSPQVGHDRHIMNSASSLPPAPERPPKPANMRFSKMTMGSRGDESRMPPKRPPKTSMTPSTGDSLHSASSLHSTFFSHYSPSAVVPPPPADHMEREIKYIEISTTQSSNVPAHTQIETIGGSALNEPVEYIQLDVSRTQALEKMKRERQMQQRANTDTHSMGKGKD